MKPPQRLLGICEASITRQNRLHFVVVAHKSLGVNQAEAVRSEILVRARVLLTVDRFATGTVGIVVSMIPTKYPESEFPVLHTK
jgi:hypothetical protein